MKRSVKVLLDGNKEWVDSINAEDPNFFVELAKGQSPDYLWIGCSDSRVPATQISNLMPGSIFVQRNIANMVIETDKNLLSVVHYAVKYLNIKHIIVCGHYGCGGVQAAMQGGDFGMLNEWLGHIKDVYKAHKTELDSITSEHERFDRYVELNVIEQVKKMAKIPTIQDAWKEGNTPDIHALVYSLKNGKLVDLDYSISRDNYIGD